MQAFGVYRRPRILIESFASLVGNITKNMRLISVAWDETSSCLYFYMNEELTELDQEAVDDIFDSFISRFTPEEMKSFDFEIMRLDFPADINYKGVCIFARKDL